MISIPESMNEETAWELASAIYKSLDVDPKNCVSLDDKGESWISIPLGKDLFLAIHGSEIVIREQRTRYNRINRVLASGGWKFNDDRSYMTPSAKRLAVEILDGAVPLLEELEAEYPNLREIKNASKSFINRADSEHFEKRATHKARLKRERTKADFIVYALLIGFLALFFYVVAEGDPNRCIYIPDPRGGYVDC